MKLEAKNIQKVCRLGRVVNPTQFRYSRCWQRTAPFIWAAEEGVGGDGALRELGQGDWEEKTRKKMREETERRSSATAEEGEREGASK